MPPYNRYRGRRRFARTPRFQKPAVEVIPSVRKRNCPCHACGLPIVVGETYSMLRLRKKFRVPCTSCSMSPAPYRRYHTACTPVDVNKAMGYDPNSAQQNSYVPPVQHTHSAPPPPLPKTAVELQMAALVAIESALKRRLAENPALANDAKLESVLKRYNGCKAHVLRPANDNEGAVALKMALKQALDLVF